MSITESSLFSSTNLTTLFRLSSQRLHNVNNNNTFLHPTAAAGGASCTGVRRTKVVHLPQSSDQRPAWAEYMTESEYRNYLATCEQSFDIMEKTFAVYTLHPNARYTI